jgi:hypothetical protein
MPDQKAGTIFASRPPIELDAAKGIRLIFSSFTAGQGDRQHIISNDEKGNTTLSWRVDVTDDKFLVVELGIAPYYQIASRRLKSLATGALSAVSKGTGFYDDVTVRDILDADFLRVIWGTDTLPIPNEYNEKGAFNWGK